MLLWLSNCEWNAVRWEGSWLGTGGCAHVSFKFDQLKLSRIRECREVGDSENRACEISLACLRRIRGTRNSVAGWMTPPTTPAFLTHGNPPMHEDRKRSIFSIFRVFFWSSSSNRGPFGRRHDNVQPELVALSTTPSLCYFVSGVFY